MRPFTFHAGLILALITTNAFGQQRIAGHPPTPGSNPNATGQGQASVKFRVDTVYFDREWAPIMDPQLRDEARYARIVRHRLDNGQPYGLVKDHYMPGWKIQSSGKLLTEHPKDVPTGHWEFFYENGGKQMEQEFTADGTLSSNRQWKEDGSEVKCTLVPQYALEETRYKLHSYFNPGNSRTVIPVSLPADAVGFVVKSDIRDEGQGFVTFENVVNVAASYSSYSPGAAMTALAKAWQTKDNPSKSNTTCRSFITTDGNAAQQWLASKGEVTPAPSTILHRTQNCTAETREFTLQQPLSNFYICVVNDNAREAATATMSVVALVPSCN